MIKDILIKSLQELTGVTDIIVDSPENILFGDYTTNVALVSAKEKGESPRKIAEDLLEKINEDKDLSKVCDKVEIAGPGFINFWLKFDVLVDTLNQIDTDKEDFGKGVKGKGKTAIIEYSSPNIAKPFTVGHLRSTIIGDAVANMLEASGWKVLRDNHLGDWGTQFGKQLFALKYIDLGTGNVDTSGEPYLEKNIKTIENSSEPVKLLVKLYVKFHEVAETNPAYEDVARAEFKQLEDGNGESRNLWQKCIDWSFVEFDRIYKILNVNFSSEFDNGRGLGESFFETRMAFVINELKEQKLLQVGEDGAKLVFFDKDKYPPLMIVKKDGATLYATRDLATDKYRKDKYDPDLIVNEVGSEQSLYFKQLFEIEKLLGWFKEGQRVHIGHGLVRFKDGKMSTRKGNVIWMEDVLEEAKKRAFNLGASRHDITWGDTFVETKSKNTRVPSRKMSEIINVSDLVAIGAIKYNDLKRDPKTEIVFDWDEILNMEGNSGPYLQYTVARINSLIEKSGHSPSFDFKNEELSSEENVVLRTLIKFPEVIEEAAENFAPNLLCNYLYDVSQKYNHLYNSEKIIGSGAENFRLALSFGVAQVLKNGLKILGIDTPERM